MLTTYPDPILTGCGLPLVIGHREHTLYPARRDPTCPIGEASTSYFYLVLDEGTRHLLPFDYFTPGKSDLHLVKRTLEGSCPSSHDLATVLSSYYHPPWK